MNMQKKQQIDEKVPGIFIQKFSCKKVAYSSIIATFEEQCTKENLYHCL